MQSVSDSSLWTIPLWKFSRHIVGHEHYEFLHNNTHVLHRSSDIWLSLLSMSLIVGTWSKVGIVTSLRFVRNISYVLQSCYERALYHIWCDLYLVTSVLRSHYVVGLYVSGGECNQKCSLMNYISKTNQNDRSVLKPCLQVLLP